MPKVSILLPNYNYRRFLEERLQTILDQTLTDWELVIVDSYSTDGAWELIQQFAEQDHRIRISQTPREGIYAGLNRCIQQACGEYIYIATSDDTMSPDGLEKMIAALEAHPECEICHTCLQVIDEQGQAIPDRQRQLLSTQLYGELMHVPHIRMAPYDGVLHCALYTMYTSLTQLLIRRSVFDKVGLFRTDWGSGGDFEWGMRAALVCNILHLPETLATWRIHPEQATTQDDLTSSALRARFCSMSKAALSILQTYNPTWYHKIRLRLPRLLFLYRYEQFMLALQERGRLVQKLLFSLQFLCIRPDIVYNFLLQRLFGSQQHPIDKIEYIREELKQLELEHYVKVVK